MNLSSAAVVTVTACAVTAWRGLAGPHSRVTARKRTVKVTVNFCRSRSAPGLKGKAGLRDKGGEGRIGKAASS